MSGSPSRAGRSHSHEGPYPIAPMASPVSLSSIAQVLVASWNTVRIISRLSSTLLCGGQPARGPTSGSEAYLNSVSASLSRKGRNIIRLFSIFVLFVFPAKNPFAKTLYCGLVIIYFHRLNGSFQFVHQFRIEGAHTIGEFHTKCLDAR